VPNRVETPPTPQLSMGLTTFAAEDPGGWDHLFTRAQMYDRTGVDRLTVSDHVVYGENLEAYSRPEIGGQAGGKQPTGPDGHWLEPLTVLTAISSVTTRVRLGTNILLAALRRPVVLSKTLSTLDVLSKGRIDIGVGVGWQREEYEAAGLQFDGRGKLLDHSLAVCQTIWRNSTANFSDELLTFENIHSMPKPVQDGGVPIWVSGTVNKNVARRLARYGSGWIPWGGAAADVQSGIKEMWELVTAEGRDPKDLQVVGTLRTVKDGDGKPDVKATVAGAPALVDAGVTDVRANFPLPDDASAAEDTLSELVGAFRAEVGRRS
jgi:probable F420-dependent oxidoreductase